MSEIISKEERDLIKSVLFGNQKQASAINDGVANMVGYYITDLYGSATISSADNFIGAMQQFLNECISSGTCKHFELLVLTCGPDAALTLQSPGPKCVRCESAGPETPKYYFGIYMLGEKPDAESTDVSTRSAPETVKPMTAEDAKKFQDLSYTAQRDFLIAKIVPTLPEAVKKELSVPAEQALVGSQWYFKNN